MKNLVWAILGIACLGESAHAIRGKYLPENLHPNSICKLTSGNSICSGGLVGPKTILTAAHCIFPGRQDIYATCPGGGDPVKVDRSKIVNFKNFSDVAVMGLVKEMPKDVKPLRIASRHLVEHYIAIQNRNQIPRKYCAHFGYGRDSSQRAGTLHGVLVDGSVAKNETAASKMFEQLMTNERFIIQNYFDQSKTRFSSTNEYDYFQTLFKGLFAEYASLYESGVRIGSDNILTGNQAKTLKEHLETPNAQTLQQALGNDVTPDYLFLAYMSLIKDIYQNKDNPGQTDAGLDQLIRQKAQSQWHLNSAAINFFFLVYFQIDGFTKKVLQYGFQQVLPFTYHTFTTAVRGGVMINPIDSGDSGSPYVCNVEINGVNEWVVFGVVSMKTFFNTKFLSFDGGSRTTAINHVDQKVVDNGQPESSDNDLTYTFALAKQIEEANEEKGLDASFVPEIEGGTIDERGLVGEFYFDNSQIAPRDGTNIEYREGWLDIPMQIELRSKYPRRN